MIRRATAADMSALLELVRAMHAEAVALRHAALDLGKVEAAFRRSIADGPAFVHVDAVGEIDGMLLAIVGERWFSRNAMVTDLVVYMRQERRGGLAAYRLLDEFIAWCDEHGIAPYDVQLGISTGVHLEATGKLYEKLGFEEAGRMYRLRSY